MREASAPSEAEVVGHSRCVSVKMGIQKIVLVNLASAIIALIGLGSCGIVVASPPLWGCLFMGVINFIYFYGRGFTREVIRAVPTRWKTTFMKAWLLSRSGFFEELNRWGLLTPIAWVMTRVYTCCGDMDMWTFGIISYGVYFWLNRLGKKRQLESELKFERWTFWQMLSSGVKAGGIMAGLMDLGLAITPRAYQASSVIADLLKCISDFVRAATHVEKGEKIKPFSAPDARSKPTAPKKASWFWEAVGKMQGTSADEAFASAEASKSGSQLRVEPVGGEEREAIDLVRDAERDQEDDDDLDAMLTWVDSLRALRDQVLEVLKKHKSRFMWFFAAVITGVVIYAWRHHRVALEAILEGHQTGRKGGNSAKAKNARGKAAHRSGPARRVTGNKAHWAYYDPQDVGAIIEVFFNGEPVDRSRVKLGVGLDQGDWAVTRKYGNALVMDEFRVGGNKRTVLSNGDNADLRKMGAHGGKTKMTISGARAKGLGFESAGKFIQLTQYPTYFHTCGRTDDDGWNENCYTDCDALITSIWLWEPTPEQRAEEIGSADLLINVPKVVDRHPHKPLPPVPKKAAAKKSESSDPKKDEVEPVDTKAVVPAKDSKAPLVPSAKAVKDKTVKTSERKAAKKESQKLEALVASSPKVDIDTATKCRIDLLDKDGKRLSSGAVAWCGIIVNQHAYADCTHFRSNGKTIEKTKIVYDTANKDIKVAAFYDGCPRPTPKRDFESPEVGQAVYLVDKDGKIARGMVHSVDEQGTLGLQARATYSSEPGDCGCVVINTNGSIVGIHFSAGRPKVDNLFFPVSESLMKLVPKNSYNPSPRE